MSHRRNCHVLVLVLIIISALAIPTFGAPPRTTFTGTETPTSPSTGGMMIPMDGVIYVLGMNQTAIDQTTDPRTNTTSTIVAYAIFNQADMTGPMWGTVTFENADGAWTGTWQGRRAWEGKDMTATVEAITVGSGDYAGLMASWSLKSVNGGPLQITGSISKEKVVERPMKLNNVVTTLEADMNPANWTWLGVDTVVIPWTAQETGAGTHLGEFQATYSGGSIIQFLPGGSMKFVTQFSEAVFTAANGDTLLVFVVPGPEEGTLLGMIRGGTGRFANARGSMIWTGDTDPDDPSVYFGAYDGTITY